MRPAGNFADRVVRPQIDVVVAAVGIGMEVTLESCEELRRPIAGTTFGEVVHRVGMLLADVGPEASLATAFFAARQHGHGRVVGPQHGRLKHQLFLSLVERPQQFGRRLNPVAQRTAGNVQTSNQLLMRDKLVQMNRILEGLTLNKFDEVKEGAKTLGMISKATSWHVSEPTPRYQRLSKNFQEQATDLERHANERNTDAATLDLVRMNVTCTQCHQHMRENADRRR